MKKSLFYISLIFIFTLFLFSCAKIKYHKDIIFKINHNKLITEITKDDITYDNPKGYEIVIQNMEVNESKNEVVVDFLISHKDKKNSQSYQHKFSGFLTQDNKKKTIIKELNNVLKELDLKDNNNHLLPGYFYNLDKVDITNYDQKNYKLIKDNLVINDTDVSFNYYLIDLKTNYESIKKQYSTKIITTKDFLDNLINKDILDVNQPTSFIWDYKLETITLNSAYKDHLVINKTDLSYNYKDNKISFKYSLSLKNNDIKSIEKEYLITNFKTYREYFDYLEENIDQEFNISYAENLDINNLKPTDFNFNYLHKEVFTYEVISFNKDLTHKTVEFKILFYLKDDKSVSRELTFIIGINKDIENINNQIEETELELIKDKNNTYLFDIKNTDFKIKDHDYEVIIEDLTKDYMLNSLTITYKIKDNDLISTKSRSIKMQGFINSEHPQFIKDIIEYIVSRENITPNLRPSVISSLIKTNYQDQAYGLSFNKLNDSYDELIGEYLVSLKGEYKKLNFEILDTKYDTLFNQDNTYQIKKISLDNSKILPNKLFNTTNINKITKFDDIFSELELYNNSLNQNCDLVVQQMSLNVIDLDLITNKLKVEVIFNHEFLKKSNTNLIEKITKEIYKKEFSFDYPSLIEALNYLLNEIVATDLDRSQHAASEFYQYINHNKIDELETLVKLKDDFSNFFDYEINLKANDNYDLNDTLGELNFNLYLSLTIKGNEYKSNLKAFAFNDFGKINQEFLNKMFSLKYTGDKLTELKTILTKYYSQLDHTSFTDGINEINLKVNEQAKTLFKPSYFLFREYQLILNKVKDATYINILNENVCLEQINNPYDVNLQLFKGNVNGFDFKFSIKNLNIEYLKAYVKKDEFLQGIRKVYFKFKISYELASPQIISFNSLSAIYL